MRVCNAIVLMAALLAAGCSWDAPPVEWEASPTPLASAADTASRFAVRWSPGASKVEAAVVRPDSVGRGPESLDGGCGATRVTTPLVRGRRWSAYWRIRPDSSAVLEVDGRDSVGALIQRIVVDSIDRARLGCARPAPAIAADSVNGYVHVSYFMVAPEGPGVFYAHLMDPRQKQFEVPMVMVYGEKPAQVAMATRGDTVAVVYEDPNSVAGRIAMSMSLTAGHLFEQTARLVPVSTSTRQATAPQIVRLDGGELWVGWTEESGGGSAFLLRRARIVTR